MSPLIQDPTTGIICTEVLFGADGYFDDQVCVSHAQLEFLNMNYEHTILNFG